MVCIWAPLFWPPNSRLQSSEAPPGACITSSAVPEKQEGDTGARDKGAAPLWGAGGARGWPCSAVGLLP